MSAPARAARGDAARADAANAAARRSRMYRARPAAVVGAGASLAGPLVLAAAGWRWAGAMLRPAPAENHDPASVAALQPEPVVFESRTGVRIVGRFFGGARRATVILTHGYGGGQDEMLPLAAALLGAGLSVLTYDLRGCGGSGGAVTFGEGESGDLSSAVDYVASRADVDGGRIGALGFSMGAATTVLAAARDPRIHAVVDDSGWSSARHWLAPAARRGLPAPLGVGARVALAALAWRSGVDLSGLRPRDVVGRISPRPLLIVHGGRDRVVPAADAVEMFAAAGPGREVWILDGADHGDTIALRDRHYAPRITDFFRRALGA